LHAQGKTKSSYQGGEAISMRGKRTNFRFHGLCIFYFLWRAAFAQAALLMEEPYGFFAP